MSKRSTTLAAPTVRKTRRAPEGGAAGRRAAVSRTGPLAGLDVAARHPLLPRLHAPTPSITVRQHAYERMLSHHLERHEPLIGRLVRAAGELYVGNGPVPVSMFPELDDLWCALSSQFDNTTRRSFGGMLREAGHRTFCLDGEFFTRRRSRFDSPEEDVLDVPVEWEIHGAQFCPLDFTQVSDGFRWNSGIATVRSKPVMYKIWSEDPYEASTAIRLLDLTRDEIYHVANPALGSLRGRPLIASALLRAIKMTTLEDAELRRKQVASLISMGVERPVDASDDEGMLPTDEEVDEMIDAISLTPGGVFQLPYGYKMTSFEPKDEPANFEKSLRWQAMMIAMSVGIPLNEVMGDEGVERWGRMMSQRVQRQAHQVHDMYEHQMLNPMRRDFVDHVQEAGLWIPPADLKPWQLYQCDWQWDPIPAARLDQELNTLMGAVDRGILPQSHVSRTLFGLKPDVAARTGARDQARLRTLGFTGGQAVWSPDTEVAARIQADVDAEETAERDLVDEALLEDSVLDD